MIHLALDAIVVPDASRARVERLAAVDIEALKKKKGGGGGGGGGVSPVYNHSLKVNIYVYHMYSYHLYARVQWLAAVDVEA